MLVEQHNSGVVLNTRSPCDCCAILRNQKTITVHFLKEQLSLFGFAEHFHAAVQSKKAVSAHFKSKRILPFGFAEHYMVDNTTFIALYDAIYCRAKP